MSVARLRAYAPPEPDTDHLTLFKEDRPRRIDRFISFFGEPSEPSDDIRGEAWFAVSAAARESAR